MKDLAAKYESYESLVDSFEVETLLMEAVGDYQGDYPFLLRDGKKYAYLVVGYGSCSGCDVLEGLYDDRKAITEFRDELWNSLVWKTKAEMRAYFRAKDEKLEWWGYDSGYQDFKVKALEILKA